MRHVPWQTASLRLVWVSNSFLNNLIAVIVFSDGVVQEKKKPYPLVHASLNGLLLVLIAGSVMHFLKMV